MGSGIILPPAQSFGIGTPKLLTNADTLSNISAPGLYAWGNTDQSPSDIPFSGGRMIVLGRGDSDFSQIALRPDTGSLVIRRIYTAGGGVLPWRWIAPPMELDTEYLLAEKYRGKDVYCKCMANGTNNSTSIAAGGTGTAEYAKGLSAAGSIVRGDAFCDINGTVHAHLPYKDASADIAVRMYYYYNATWRARLSIDSSVAITNVYGCLWYTKN